MARHRSRSPIRRRSPSRSPARRKHYDDPRDRHGDRRSPAPSGLLVRNISLSARPEDLRTPFERYGPIKDIYLPKNYYTGEPRGFGFVKFRYPEDAAEAKSHLDRSVIGGREIRIVFAEENRKTPQEMRGVSRTSSRGSYRRRGRSRSPRRRDNSYSRSPPARHDSRGRYDGARDENSPHRSRSVSRSVSPRDDRVHRSRERSPRRSKPVSPQHEKDHKVNHHSPTASPVEIPSADAPSRYESPRKNSKNLARPRSRSYSPR